MKTRWSYQRFGEEASPDEVAAALNARNVSAARAFIAHTGDPPTYRAALRTPHSKEWETALGAEYKQLIDTGTFEWIKDLLHTRKTIGSKLVCHEKLS